MKSVALIICLALLCVAHTQAQNSTADENEEAYREYVKADKGMNRIYQQCLNEAENAYLKTDANGEPLKNRIAAALKLSQKAFVTYQAKENEYLKAAHEQGAAAPYYIYTAMKKLTEERIKELKDNL